MKSDNEDINGELATKFLKEHTKNKTVVGISAVFYAMLATDAIEKVDILQKKQVTQIEIVAGLRKKLDKLYEFTEEDGAFKIDLDGNVKTFENDKKFLTEVSNVKLQLTYFELLYHPTAKGTFAREWKVNQKPFRTTWSTGWYINFLKYEQKLRTGKSKLILKFLDNETKCYIERPGDNLVQELPESAAKHAKNLKSIGDFFRNDEEESFKKCIIEITKRIQPDSIEAKFDECYWNEKKGATLPTLVKRKIALFAQLNIHFDPEEKWISDETRKKNDELAKAEKPKRETETGES